MIPLQKILIAVAIRQNQSGEAAGEEISIRTHGRAR